MSRANLAGTKSVPRFTHALLADHTEGLIALSGYAQAEDVRRATAARPIGVMNSGSSGTSPFSL